MLADAELGAGRRQRFATARRVEIYGIGGSAPLALDAYHKLMKLGICATSGSTTPT